jgi:hypothetical protein
VVLSNLLPAAAMPGAGRRGLVRVFFAMGDGQVVEHLQEKRSRGERAKIKFELPPPAAGVCIGCAICGRWASEMARGAVGSIRGSGGGGGAGGEEGAWG